MSKSTLLSVVNEEDAILASRVKQSLVDMLIYGITGTWKSPLLASVKDIESLNPIYIDIESGSHAAHKKGLDIIEFAAYHMARCKEAKKKPSEFDSLFQLITALKKDYINAPKDDKPFNCILYDGWTETYEIVHAQAKLDGSGDKEVGTQNDRTRSLVRIKQFSRLLRSIPVHIISTAREYAFISDNSSAILERGPQLSGATMKYVSAQVDIVARLRVVGNKLQFSVKEDSVTIARDRFFLLPDKVLLDTPSLSVIWEYIEGKKKR